MGLSSSIIYRIKDKFKCYYNKDNKKKNSKNEKKTENNLKKYIKLVLYIYLWLEYNVKLYTSVYLRTVNKTIIIYDRTFHDLLMNCNSKLIWALFINYTYKPSVLINITCTYLKTKKRKDEIDENQYVRINKFIRKYSYVYKKNSVNVFNLNNEKNDTSCATKILNSIMQNN